MKIMLDKPRPRASRVALAIAALAAIAAGGVWRSVHESTPSSAAPMQAVALSPIAVPVGQPDGGFTPAPSHFPLTPAPPKPSKAAAFDANAKGTPSQQFRGAYMLVVNCLEPQIVARFNNDPRNFKPSEAPEQVAPPTDIENCGDLNAKQLTDTDTRLAVLIPAVKAGVKGAWSKLIINEGPSGILSKETGPGSLTPEQFQALKAEGLQAAIEHADPAALERQAYALERSGTEADRIKAIEYRVAIVRNGPISDLGGKPDPTQTPAFKRITAGLDQATIDAAIKRGELLASKVIR